MVGTPSISDDECRRYWIGKLMSKSHNSNLLVNNAIVLVWSCWEKVKWTFSESCIYAREAVNSTHLGRVHCREVNEEREGNSSESLKEVFFTKTTDTFCFYFM